MCGVVDIKHYVWCCRCGHDVCEPRPRLAEDRDHVRGDVSTPRLATTLAVPRRATQ